MDVLIAILTALLIDLAFGDPPNRFHPVVAMGSCIRWGSEHAPANGSRKQFLFGMGWVLLGGLLFSLPWLLLEFLGISLSVWIRGLIMGILLKPMISLRNLIEAGRSISVALRTGDLLEARRLAAWHLVSRDTSQLSTGQVASAAIESLAENLTDSLLAPLLAFIIGGLPAAWFYRFVNTADAMIGYHTSRYEYLGKFTARLDDVLNWLPARLAALALVAAAWLCRLNPSDAWRVMVSQHSRTASPNAGWTMAAASGALGVRFEKVGYYRLEGGPELPLVDDIQRASVLLLVGAGLVILFGLGAAYGINLAI